MTAFEFAGLPMKILPPKLEAVPVPPEYASSPAFKDPGAAVPVGRGGRRSCCDGGHDRRQGVDA